MATGTFVYDAHDLRARQQINGQTHYSVYSLSGQLKARHRGVHGQTDQSRTVYLPFGVRLQNGLAEYIHKDHLSNPVAATSNTNAGSELLWRALYTPFGQKRFRNAAGPIATPANEVDNEGFTGHIDDAATGLTYMQARYYDPKLARFLSIDPVTFMDTGAPEMFNRYAYAINDPINHNDPTGEIVPAIAACAAIPACRGAVGTVVGAVAGGVGAAISGDNMLKGAGKGAVVGVTGAVTVKVITEKELTTDTIKDAIVEEATGKVAGKALKMLDDVPTEFTEPAVSATDSALTAITPAGEPVEVEQPDREDQ